MADVLLPYVLQRMLKSCATNIGFGHMPGDLNTGVVRQPLTYLLLCLTYLHIKLV